MKNSITLKDLIIEMGRQAGNSHELGAGFEFLFEVLLTGLTDGEKEN